MLNLFDINPPSREVTQQRELEGDLRDQHYKELLIGKVKDEVVELIGKPETIYKGEKSLTIYTGEDIEYDERWCYWFRYKGVYGSVGYGVYVYIKDGIAIYVGSG